MDDTRLYMIASDVSIPVQEPSAIYQLVEMRMFSTQPNGNRQGVTEAFIDNIVEHPEKYNCLPLYVDVDRLRCRDYRNLGHMLDRRTGTYGTTMIGSLCSFRKVNDEYGVSLMAQARIPRREADICRAIMDLYAMRILNFSYEIKYTRDGVIEKDGVTYVDASENNNIIGMAVVSVPAYPESTAQSLIAEDQNANAENLEDINDVNDRDDHNEHEDDQDDHDPETDDDDNDNEGADNMTLEEAMSAIAEKDARIAELESNLNAEKQNVENEKKVKEDELAQAACDKEKVEAELSTAQNSIAEKDQRIAELESQVAELEPMKAELESIKAEKEAQILAEKQNKAKSFAERQGLDVEKDEVKSAIASQNYEAIASMAMDINQEPEQKVTLASFAMSDGMEIDDKYGDLLKIR